ncbi:MAG: hypothetical protein ABFD20_07550 [Anaerolineales bacterium]
MKISFPTWRSLLWLAILWVAGLGSAATVAADGDGLCLPVVVPLDGAGSAQLQALRVTAELHCDQGRCALASEQQLYVVNNDEVAAAQLRLGLRDCAATLTSLTATGATVNVAGDGTVARIEPRGQAQLTAVLTLDPVEVPVLSGKVALTQARGWGKVDTIHVELTWPALTAGANVQIEPAPQRQQGRTAVWNWTAPDTDLSWTVLNPALAAALASASDDPAATCGSAPITQALARVQSTEPLSAAEEQLVPRLLWALDDAVQAAPDDLACRQALAQAYLGLAERRADRRLNYLLLGIDQLEAVLALDPAEESARQALGEAYHQAALDAHAAGDPESALGYLARAAEVAPSEAIAQAQDEFMLQWGLDLARQGQVAEAIALLQDADQLPVAQELARFAPPIEYARTTVLLAPERRTVTYELALYAPVAAETDAEIQAALADLAAVAGPALSTTVHADGGRREVTISLAYPDLATLAAARADLVAALEVRGSLIAELLAAPWRGQTEAWQIETSLWGRTEAYREVVDTTPLATAWQSGADYAHWWLVELHAQRDAAESATAHELALLALSEQSTLWATVPDNLHWLYMLDGALNVGDAQDAPRWQVGMGETRTLDYTAEEYDWRGISELAAGAIAALGLLALVLTLSARRRARRRRTG